MKKIYFNPDNKGGRFLFLWLGGMLTGFTLVFPQAGLLEWFTLIPAAVILLKLTRSDIKLPRAYGYGVFFFMSFYTVIFHWFIYLYPLEFTGMSRWAAVVVVLSGWFGLSFLQSIVGGLMFVFAVLIGRLNFIKKHPLIMPFIIASLWSVHEWWQTLFWSGVPWGRLPIGQTDIPIMIQTASLFGSYIITFALVSVNFCISLAICDGNKRKTAVVCAAGIMLANLMCGAVIAPLTASKHEGRTLRAALIQGNIASGEKWDMTLGDIIDIYEDYTIKTAAMNPDVIIWPETAVPTILAENSKTAKRLSDITVRCGVPVIVGILTEDDEGNEYNSLVMFLPDGTISKDVYSKRHLVPFGEYMPMRELLSVLIPPLAEVAMLDEDVTPGDDSGIIEHDGIRYGSLICFDSIYEQLVRDSVLDGAGVIVISTNDSWFYDSAAGRMHNAQAKLRAVESGRYVLRAANTGISSVINPAGKMTHSLPALAGGYIVADVETRYNMTLYMRIGNLFIAACALFCLVPFAANIGLSYGKKRRK